MNHINAGAKRRHLNGVGLKHINAGARRRHLSGVGFIHRSGCLTPPNPSESFEISSYSSNYDVNMSIIITVALGIRLSTEPTFS